MRGCKQYNICFDSDEYNKHRYNRATDDYGSHEHEAGRASTLKSAKAIISKARKDYAEQNPRHFKVYDTWNSDSEGFATCVYTVE